jgi:hypothetical protein
MIDQLVETANALDQAHVQQQEDTQRAAKIVELQQSLQALDHLKRVNE